MLGTSKSTGLANDEARVRLASVGPNEIVAAARRSPLRMLAVQFADATVLVLLGAAAIAAFLGEVGDIAAIVAIVVLNAILGFVQEYRAERALAALKAMAALTARVKRDGVETSLPSAVLVPGDLVVLEAGNAVPADLRIIEAITLRVDESTLTGESQPVEKLAASIAKLDTPVADRRNIVYKGTTIAHGRGSGVVVATGMTTELGRIAALLRDSDAPRTPLQIRLARFGRNLAVIIVALCGVIFVAGLLRGEEPTLMFMTALSLAVAAVPEALPAVVTVALALGARAMVKRNALIRRLPAVETLGSVTYICSDKTGTLTENRMRAEVLLIDSGLEHFPMDGTPKPVRALLLEAIALNNDAVRGANGALIGDPTETALYRAAEESGKRKESLEAAFPRVAELSFSADRSRMTTLHRRDDGILAFTKGAPERVVPRCVDRITGDGLAPIDCDAVLLDAERMAASGLRVLAISMRRLGAEPPSLEDAEAQQTLLGLIGLVDPPRPEAKAAVMTCQAAGIRVVMITGDHAATARSIARRLGIASENDTLVSGSEIAAMSGDELTSRVLDIRVYARVAPEDKIRIVEALQQRGQFVAMTGDGVNDAPALRRANIGVSMGKAGTDVAREASHMVLLDDNFATIVSAVREGRRIYDNIRRFVRYILSTNSGEIWTLFLAPFLGLPLPLLPIHILWMNLVTDGLPGLALAAEPAELDVMRRPPRAPDESIFAGGLWQHALWVGLLMAGLALGTQAFAIHIADSHWQSVTFTVLTFSQLAHALAIRSERESLFRQGLFSNKALAGTVGLTILLQLSTLYVPPLARAFRTAPLSARELAACFGVASVIFVAVELEKLIRRRHITSMTAASADHEDRLRLR
jgi:P-type Ca2+ transporter type 2C